MGKGAFLKENRQKERSAAMQPEHREESAGKAVPNKKRRCRLAGVGIAATALILAAAIVMILMSNPLTGRWNMDEVTSYAFSRNGKGALVLPSAQYDFIYTVDGNVVNIDFIYEGAKDAQYTFTVEGDVLTLNGGSSTTQGTYVLTRSK